jgi:hypothetical protein
MSISADRSVSTSSLRLAHGMIPAVEEKLAFHDEAFLPQAVIGECTGLEPTKVLSRYYPKQRKELGIVLLSHRGKFGMVPTKSGDWRGESSRWILDLDAYTPRDIPVMDLETAPYWGDLDHDAIVPAMKPTSNTWAKEPEAYRLALALLHHGGLAKVKVTPYQAAEILGKSRVTGWRTLRKLEQMGLYRNGWADLSILFRDATLAYDHPELTKRTKAHQERRWTVFTKEGWEVRDAARQWREMLPRIDAISPVSKVFAHHVGHPHLEATVRYVREVFSRPDATGQPVRI